MSWLGPSSVGTYPSESVAGRAVMRYCDTSPALRTNLKRHFLPAIMFVLELNGAQGVDGHVSRDDVADGKLVFEVTVTYKT